VKRRNRIKHSIFPTIFIGSTHSSKILKWLVEGMSYKMIADVCSISADTVNGHIKNIYKNSGYTPIRSGGEGDKKQAGLNILIPNS